MKILMLIPYAPYPPNSGGRIRLWEEIQYLSQRHELTVVSFQHSQQEYELQSMLMPFCKQAKMVKHPNKVFPASLESVLKLPLVFQWYYTPEMKKVLQEIGHQNFDLVLIQHIFMAQYQELFACPTVLEEHNIESAVMKQQAQLRLSSDKAQASQKERAFQHIMGLLMAKYENETWPKFPLRITVSEKDKEELNRRCQIGKTVVVENGVNVHSTQLVENRHARKILFMGTMNYYPNVDAAFYFVEAILPKIRERDPTITLVISGRDPTRAVQNLAYPGLVEVVANPEDMGIVAKECRLTVVPLRIGGGTRIKILQSMAMGLPVVTTTLGCEGLMVEDNCHLLIQDNPSLFADSVLRLLQEDHLYQSLRISGRKLVEEQYDWERIFAKAEREMTELVETSRLAK